ncbi:MAG: DMT family transporter [Pseudorhodoplanes sp.]|nr:DMT family transporter [Pseudorhodoplanes sp.]
MTERARAYLILLIMPMFFSTNIVIARAAVATVEPWTLAFWRWSLASLVVLPFAWHGLVAHRRALLAEWKTIALLGVLGMVICGGIVYLGLKSTTATNGVLIYTSTPVFVLLLEAIFRGQRASRRQVAGIVLALLGVATILLHGDPARLNALGSMPATSSSA